MVLPPLPRAAIKSGMGGALAASELRGVQQALCNLEAQLAPGLGASRELLEARAAHDAVRAQLAAKDREVRGEGSARHCGSTMERSGMGCSSLICRALASAAWPPGSLPTNTNLKS